jgi:hypothetical protein
VTVSLHIRVEGLDELKRKLGANWTQPIQAGAIAIGEELRTVVATYPGAAHHPVIWASDKQRRWWFAARREANLPFHYTRNSDAWSQRLGPSWTVRPEGLTSAVVGTKATYAPFAQSDKQQTAQHKETGWVTDKQAVAEVERGGKALRIMRDIVQRWLKR